MQGICLSCTLDHTYIQPIQYFCSMKLKKPVQTHIQLVILARLGIMLVAYFLSRILFFFFNFRYFSGAGFPELMKIFFVGLRFDISAILILNVPYILLSTIPFRFRSNKAFRVVLNVYFYGINTVGLMTNFIDLIYYRFTLKRLTADIFNYLGVGGDFGKLIPQFTKDFWYVLVIFILFASLTIFFCTRFRARTESAKKGFWPNFAWYFLQTIVFAAMGAVTVIGIRGGLQLRPIGLITAGRYTPAKNIPLLLNTPFSIVKTFQNENLQTIRFYAKEQDLEKVYTPIHKGKSAELKKMNVVILMMESFSLEHIGSLNRDLENGSYQGFTPFFDSLVTQSLVFRAYANGKTSIQGIPAVLSGIPSLLHESLLQSNYMTDRLTSVASLLKPYGYTSAFFHGGTNGTMAFDNYTRMVGFDNYYGRTEYNNEKDYDGKWGIRDEEFFQYFARKTDGMKQPFVVAFFSLSSHHPYYVPGKYLNKFRKGHLPIQESIMYADYSMGRYFQTIRKSPWYSNTLFVITADHTSEGYYPYYQTDAGQFSVPILFFKPGSDLKGIRERIAQQTDILPSILDYLNYGKDYVAYGSSVFDTTAPRFSVHFISGIYSLIRDHWLLQFDGKLPVAFFDLKADPLQQVNLVTRNLPEQARLVTFLKAYIQQYNNRVIENRLTAE